MNRMLKTLVFFCSVLLSSLANKAYSQVFQSPNNSYGINSHRNAPDSTFYEPTGCGVPTDSSFLFSQGFAGQGEKKKMAAKYYDSCGHHEYVWDPSTRAWHQSDGSGGGSSSFAGLNDVALSSIANGQITHWNSGTSKWNNFTPGPTDVNGWLGYTAGNVANRIDQNNVATNSAQLRGVISDETGTGFAVFSTSPVFTTPRLASSSTTGYVWTATDNLGNGSFQAAAGGGSSFYQTVQSNAGGVTQRAALNFGLQFSVTDNSGNGSSDIGIASSVALSGSPTTTTQAGSDSSTKIATTAMVHLALAAHTAYFAGSDLSVGLTNPDSLYAGGFLVRDAHHSGSNLYNHYFDSTWLYYTPPSLAAQPLDTSNNLLVIWNKSTHRIDKMSWQVPGVGGSTLTRQNISTGSSGTVGGGNYIVKFNPSTAISAYALTTPPSPSDKDVMEIEAGGTITSGNVVVTSITIIANTGQSLVQEVNPNGTALLAGEYLKYRYDSSTTSWYREQ